MSKRFSVLNVLCSVINSSNYSSVNYFLAHYFLSNFEKLSDLNIHDVADDCYCTRQSVRRFCQKIGFSNFVSLKSYLIRYNHLRWEQLRIYNTDDFTVSMPKHINLAIESINRKVSAGEFNPIVDAINEQDNIVFIVDESIKSLIFQLQKAMIFNNKIVKIISNGVSGATLLDTIFEEDNTQGNTILGSIGQDDLVITISLSGNFASVIDEVVSGISAKRYLITNFAEFNAENYEQVFYLEDDYKDYYGTNAYTIFGLNYFLENLVNMYIHKYGSKDVVKDKRALDTYISGNFPNVELEGE